MSEFPGHERRPRPPIAVVAAHPWHSLAGLYVGIITDQKGQSLLTGKTPIAGGLTLLLLCSHKSIERTSQNTDLLLPNSF